MGIHALISAVKRAGFYAQGPLALSRDDFILASFPKSGSTWVRFFLANLISLAEWKGRVVDWGTLDQTMPEFGASDLFRSWPVKCVPRVVKTHEAYLPFFPRHRSILLIRDPKDVMVSYFYHVRARKRQTFEGSFQEFVRHPRFGLEAWFRHYRSWITRCAFIVKYEDLRKDDTHEFLKILQFLHAHFDENLFEEAVKRSRFEQMRAVEKQYGLGGGVEVKDGFLFTRKGLIGDWKEHFDQPTLEYYHILKNRYDLRGYE